MRKLLPIIILLILLVLASAFTGVYMSLQRPIVNKGQLTVHFLNVGKGDCILVQTPDERNVLIDSGSEDTSEFVINYLRRFAVHRIDLVVISHASDDDIGGMSNIFREFGVSRVVDVGTTNRTAKYDELLKDIDSRRIDYKGALECPDLLISKDASFKIVWPSPDFHEGGKGSAGGAAVLRIAYDDVAFLLMGDTDTASEGRMLSLRQDLQSSVLQVARHGAADGTCNELLRVVQPDYAVIPSGDEDGKGPAQSTVERLLAVSARVFRTDIRGSVIFSTDGRHVHIATER